MNSPRPLRDGSELVIREANPRDAARVVAYVDAVSGESDNLTFGTGELDITPEDEEVLLAGYESADNRVFLIALRHGEIVACLSFGAGARPRLRHVGSFGMSVRRSCWNLGIGSALLDALLQWARQGGIVTKINLEVRTDNAAAIHLYEKKGFRIEGTNARTFRIAGTYYGTHAMGLCL